MMLRIVSVSVVAALAGLLGSPLANADRPEPVPMYGYYNSVTHHSRQTFNGMPRFSDPSTFVGLFTTHCDLHGCVVDWLRETEITQNPNAPALYQYSWNNDRWESSGDYPFYCGPDGSGGLVNTFRSDWLKPNGDGSFSGERTFDVPAPGCPGDGPGTYWVPLTLTPVDPPG